MAAATAMALVALPVLETVSSPATVTRIAAGPPAEVLRDPGVVASYLGTDESAIARSGAGVPVPVA